MFWPQFDEALKFVPELMFVNAEISLWFLFCTVTGCVVGVPTSCGPKFSEGGLRTKGWSPIPVRGTTSGLSVALLATVRLPVRVPERVGANVRKT